MNDWVVNLLEAKGWRNLGLPPRGSMADPRRLRFKSPKSNARVSLGNWDICFFRVDKYRGIVDMISIHLREQNRVRMQLELYGA
jgi:hypothetical protein